ncbi:MAG: metallophosphoesterase, partial [Gammaproteobacteria bacterium]|nr:metallophosphoesterase [Gammaproteobacteria bacterium]
MRWLHLSDIHVGQPDQARSNAMRLLVDAIQERSDNEPIDLVLFTGDLAYSGRTEEYASLVDELIEPLRRLECTQHAHFIAVPGNHDLDCDCSHPIVWDMLGQRRQEKFWESDQKGIDLRAARARGFDAFATFLDANSIMGPDPTTQVGKRLDLELRNGAVTVICLNTALFSDKHLSADDEREASPLPVQSLRALANEGQRAKSTLVLGHHPLDWFDKRTKQNFLSALRDLGAIYLHGHTHQIEGHFGSHALASVGFGSVYPSHIDHQLAPFTSTFAICQLAEELHIRFVSWEPDFGVWRPSQSVPGDFNEPSDMLSDAYRVPVPNTKSTTVMRSNAFREVETPLHLDSPIWIDAPYVEKWAMLLGLVGEVEQEHEIVQQTLKSEIGGQASFILTDRYGRHGVRAFSAETTIITYEHVEAVNTELDTLQLDSYIVATLGKTSASAADLAANLRRTKRITVLDGVSLARQLASTSTVKDLLSDHLSPQSAFVPQPLIAPNGLAFLLVAAPTGDRYVVLDQDGGVLGEHTDLVRTVREKLPQLASLQYGLHLSIDPELAQTRNPFDRDGYLRRCLSTYDTANYAGLAAIGIRLPVESLRKIYVPTAANVQSDQAAMEATHRAIDDLVEALGLDEVQKMQLARQMKSTYGVRSTSEVDAASGLYQALSNIVLLGDPGSGKSCFVRAQVMAYCEPPTGGDGDWYSQHVPVFLPLAEYSDALAENSPILNHYVAHAQSQQLALDLPQLKILLSRGKVAFFFDGLDEIGSIATRQDVVAQLADLLSAYAPLGNRFVLTSRPAAVRDLDLPPGLTSLSLQGLTDNEIRLLATRLFEGRYPAGTAITEQDQRVIDTILQDCEAKPGIRRLARNPLLLTLLVFIYENSGSFAARRHLIYSQAVKTLVSVRHRDILRARLSEADLRTRLGRLAVAIFQRQVSPLPTRGEVASFLEQQLPLKHDALNQFVQDVAEITGLLIVHPRGVHHDKDLVSFMHHSFLEYYTALGLLEDDADIEEAFAYALTPRWSEIVTLMFGILDEQIDVTERLRQLGTRQTDSDIITVRRLAIALDCALECDVPPEAAQLYLANEVNAIMAEGPGLYDLVRQLSWVLQRKNLKWSAKWVGILTRLLLACDQAGAQLSPGLARRAIELVDDFKTPDDIRRQAMRFFGQACPTTSDAAEVIANQ